MAEHIEYTNNEYQITSEMNPDCEVKTPYVSAVFFAAFFASMVIIEYLIVISVPTITFKVLFIMIGVAFPCVFIGGTFIYSILRPPLLHQCGINIYSDVLGTTTYIYTNDAEKDVTKIQEIIQIHRDAIDNLVAEEKELKEKCCLKHRERMVYLRKGSD